MHSINRRNLGMDGDKIKLIAYRDFLFDKYLDLLDKHNKWKKGQAPLPIGYVTSEKTTRKQITTIIENRLQEISAKLRDLDEKITFNRSANDLYTHIKEIY